MQALAESSDRWLELSVEVRKLQSREKKIFAAVDPTIRFDICG
jgi:hypothetical protein